MMDEEKGAVDSPVMTVQVISPYTPQDQDDPDLSVVVAEQCVSELEVIPPETPAEPETKDERRTRVYDMMRTLQQKHLADILQGDVSSTLASEASENLNICRICHSVGEETLITPCRCSGSAKFVHATCLLTWFKKAVKNTCELCRCKVAIKKKGKPLTEWRRPEDRPVPLVWFFVFFVGLVLNVFSIAVNASELCDSTACIIFYVVNGFGVILDAAFLYFWWTKCVFYWRKWCALNQEWSIVRVHTNTPTARPEESSEMRVSNGHTLGSAEMV